MNVTKYVGSLLTAFSDAGSTPAASTIPKAEHHKNSYFLLMHKSFISRAPVCVASIKRAATRRTQRFRRWGEQIDDQVGKLSFQLGQLLRNILSQMAAPGKEERQQPHMTCALVHQLFHHLFQSRRSQLHEAQVHPIVA